ncbi:hypothetical protein PIIN_10661 [Serendipita indica DSM 11827]|uniref:Uncharacterized protein n=1 Tax=Serendipita indica (strain DSM 11827) TaxID=1109443 RepID=G4TZC9_SERID|nr:hypothetical protein PIIN_10661 [Serendipita indica DSM 11827]
MASRQSSNIQGDFPGDRLGPSDDCVGCLSPGAEQRSYTELVEPMLCQFFYPVSHTNAQRLYSSSREQSCDGTSGKSGGAGQRPNRDRKESSDES